MRSRGDGDMVAIDCAQQVPPWPVVHLSQTVARTNGHCSGASFEDYVDRLASHEKGATEGKGQMEEK